MKSFDTDLKKYSEKIKLKVSERKELRERILSYMEYHPLPKQASVESVVAEGIISEHFVKFKLSALQLRFVGGTLALLLIVVPIFAERSVPGEVLYILKTGVNEKIQGQLANSPYEKIEFETKLMERRISEARLLANEGKLTEEARHNLETTVKNHAQIVQNELSELRGQDADSAAIAEIVYNSSLEVQSEFLDASEGGGELLGDIRNVVNSVRSEAISAQGDTVPSYIGLAARVETQTTRAYELFETIKSTASTSEIEDIERRLSDINRQFGEAKEMQKSDEEGAVKELSGVVGQVQKLITFMTNLDVREVVSLEALVPVVLSKEERITRSNEEITSIESLLLTVTTRVENDGAIEGLEKINEGLSIVTDLLTKAKTASGLSELQVAEQALAEARSYITDLNALTTPVVEETTMEEVVEVGEVVEETATSIETQVEGQ